MTLSYNANTVVNTFQSSEEKCKNYQTNLNKKTTDSLKKDGYPLKCYKGKLFTDSLSLEHSNKDILIMQDVFLEYMPPPE